MAKKILTRIQNNDTIEILEDAKKGDIIVLSEINTIDKSFINKVIEEKYEQKIKEKLQKQSKELEDKFNSEQTSFKNEILLEKEKEIGSLKEKYIEKINELEKKLNKSETSKKTEINEARLEFEKEKHELESKLNVFEKEKENLLKVKELEYKINLSKFNESKQKEITELNSKIDAQTNEILKLKNEKNSLNIKKLGEHLEKWCNEEIQNYMLSSFSNCKWYKDNTIVEKTKADYIFEIYTDENKNSKIVSACLEMKSEFDCSDNKKKNENHFKKLDEDRHKKNCKYALLVSELEWELNNDSPIKRVQCYDDMYIVRPSYMTTFLSLLNSLSLKYKELINKEYNEELKFKNVTDILNDFDELKRKYLETPIKIMEDDYKIIKKEADKIKESADIISKNADKFFDSSLKKIKNKIENFNIKKIIKKIDKNNE